MKTIHVQYFAALREQRGLTGEAVQTDAMTPRALYTELQLTHAFTLSADRLRVARNEAFVPWESSLNDGDTIVFIPPVAGG
ncbi:MAG: MoaD/ThiS family protein [Candidatus Hydrogenedentes bacterium]|nr:MoaD/ThiS family protein [Candidatus Hydrogenedentota bacterium]